MLEGTSLGTECVMTNEWNLLTGCGVGRIDEHFLGEARSSLEEC